MIYADNISDYPIISGDLSRAGDWVLRGQQQPRGGGHSVQPGSAPARPQLQVTQEYRYRDR